MRRPPSLLLGLAIVVGILLTMSAVNAVVAARMLPLRQLQARSAFHTHPHRPDAHAGMSAVTWDENEDDCVTEEEARPAIPAASRPATTPRTSASLPRRRWERGAPS